jgi:hypothetical protein
MKDRWLIGNTIEEAIERGKLCNTRGLEQRDVDLAAIFAAYPVRARWQIATMQTLPRYSR